MENWYKQNCGRHECIIVNAVRGNNGIVLMLLFNSYQLEICTSYG